MFSYDFLNVIFSKQFENVSTTEKTVQRWFIEVQYISGTSFFKQQMEHQSILCNPLPFLFQYTLLDALVVD